MKTVLLTFYSLLALILIVWVVISPSEWPYVLAGAAAAVFFPFAIVLSLAFVAWGTGIYVPQGGPDL